MTPASRWLGVVLAAALTLLLPTPATAAPTACPSVGRDFAAPGPFPVTEAPSGKGHTVFRPTELGSRGCDRHPVVLWGNGTFVTPVVYAPLLRHWASHGFIVAAADTTQSGSGHEMLTGLDFLTTENARPGSPFQHRVDLAQVAATGHSQGGGGAINAGADPRVRTTVPIQPGPLGRIAALGGPMLILAGERDLTVLPGLLVLPRYHSAGHIVAVYGSLAGASHVTPAGNGGGYRGPITAWLRAQLLGDPLARKEFFGKDCGQCANPAWADFRRNEKALAVPAA